MARIDGLAAALALGDALGSGEAADFFSFAETIRGEQKAKAMRQTLLTNTDLFFIILLCCFANRMTARMVRTGGMRVWSWSNESKTIMQSSFSPALGCSPGAWKFCRSFRPRARATCDCDPLSRIGLCLIDRPKNRRKTLGL